MARGAIVEIKCTQLLQFFSWNWSGKYGTTDPTSDTQIALLVLRQEVGTSDQNRAYHHRKRPHRKLFRSFNWPYIRYHGATTRVTLAERLADYGDKGYQGLQDDHPDVEIPYKKSKYHPLTKDEKDYNHSLSRFRVRVEYTFAKLKSFRMLSERYRYSKATYAAKFAIIAGIVNLRLAFKLHSQMEGRLHIFMLLILHRVK